MKPLLTRYNVALATGFRWTVFLGIAIEKEIPIEPVLLPQWCAIIRKVCSKKPASPLMALDDWFARHGVHDVNFVVWKKIPFFRIIYKTIGDLAQEYGGENGTYGAYPLGLLRVA